MVRALAHTLRRGLVGALQLRPYLPKFRKQNHIQNLTQIVDACGAAGTDLVTDHALDGYDVVEAPAAEVVVYVDELFREVTASCQIRLQIVQSII